MLYGDDLTLLADFPDAVQSLMNRLAAYMSSYYLPSILPSQ